MCSYNQTFMNSTESKNAFEMFGVHASHALLPSQTFVEVMLDINRSITVQINGYPLENNKTVLELSKEAAQMLGIIHEGLFPCTLGVWEAETDYSVLKSMIGVFGSFFGIVYLIIHFM